MARLPPAASQIDRSLLDVGLDHDYQRVVFGQVSPESASALVVAVLHSAHPQGEGVVGRFYGVHLRGFLDGSLFRPWRTEPLGEVQWDDAQGWVQVAA